MISDGLKLSNVQYNSSRITTHWFSIHSGRLCWCDVSIWTRLLVSPIQSWSTVRMFWRKQFHCVGEVLALKKPARYYRLYRKLRMSYVHDMDFCCFFNLFKDPLWSIKRICNNIDYDHAMTMITSIERFETSFSLPLSYLSLSPTFFFLYVYIIYFFVSCFAPLFLSFFRLHFFFADFFLFFSIFIVTFFSFLVGFLVM
jgi:hypothetical protein